MTPLLQELLGHPDHVFWCDVLSWNVADAFVEDALLHHGCLTTARQHQGGLKAMDADFKDLEDVEMLLKLSYPGFHVSKLC